MVANSKTAKKSLFADIIFSMLIYFAASVVYKIFQLIEMQNDKEEVGQPIVLCRCYMTFSNNVFIVFDKKLLFDP